MVGRGGEVGISEDVESGYGLRGWDARPPQNGPWWCRGAGVERGGGHGGSAWNVGVLVQGYEWAVKARCDEGVQRTRNAHSWCMIMQVLDGLGATVGQVDTHPAAPEEAAKVHELPANAPSNTLRLPRQLPQKISRDVPHLIHIILHQVRVLCPPPGPLKILLDVLPVELVASGGPKWW